MFHTEIQEFLLFLGILRKLFFKSTPPQKSNVPSKNLYVKNHFMSLTPMHFVLSGRANLTIWDKVREIPYGELRSYKWVARSIGSAHASRAVGNAVGRNPVAPIVPCHRVICSDGSLGGYSSGIAIKKRLLNLEGISGDLNCVK